MKIIKELYLSYSYCSSKLLISLLFLLINYSITISQGIYIFRQAMPPSQWIDYSPERPESAVVLDGEGGAIIVSQAFVNNWLIAQKIDRYGNVLWSETGQARKVVLDMPPLDSGYAPILLSDYNGGAYIVYAYGTWNEVGGNGWYNYDVYVQHIDRNFNRLWGNRGIAVAASDSVIPEYPFGIVHDDKGGLYILY